MPGLSLSIWISEKELLTIELSGNINDRIYLYLYFICRGKSLRKFIFAGFLIIPILLVSQLFGLTEEQTSNNTESKAKMAQWAKEMAALPNGPQKPSGLVWVYGRAGDRYDSPRTQGAGIHVMPGWVLVDKSVLNGLPLITVTTTRQYDRNEINYLAIRSIPSSSEHFAWLEVPGLREHPTASIHQAPFIAGTYLFGFLENISEKGKVYRTANENGRTIRIERATSAPFAYSLGWSEHGPDFIGAYALFDVDGSWSGFLMKVEPPRGLKRRLFESPAEETWIQANSLLDKAPVNPAHSMKGFPFASFSKAISGWDIHIEDRVRLADYCAQNSEEPWGWFALGMAQSNSGLPADGLAAFYRAAQQLSDSALVNWKLADVLASSLSFEKALPYFERALQLDPSLANWGDKAKQIGSVYHVLGKHDRESLIRFGSIPSPKDADPEFAFDYAEWLISHNRYSEAEEYFRSAWESPGEEGPYSWIFTNNVLEKLLETLYYLDRTNDIPRLFKGTLAQMSDDHYRSELAKYWSRHGIAENNIAIYQQWLRSTKEADWLYQLPKAVLEKLWANDRQLMRAAFAGEYSIDHWLFYKLENCGDFLNESGNLRSPDIANQVMCLNRLNRKKEAIELIAKTSSQEQDSSFVHWAGDLWRETGEYDRAKTAYMAEIADTDGYWLRWQGLGQVLEALGEKKKAVDAYSKALQLNKDHLSDEITSSERYPLFLLKKLVSLGKENEVLEFCRHNIQIGSGLSENNENKPEEIIEFLCSLKAGDIAVSALRNNIRYDPGHAPSWLRLGRLYSRLGDRDEATICLQRLKILNGDMATTLEKEITKGVP
jgi:tetratricopeptide (TPR) repeat protein